MYWIIELLNDSDNKKLNGFNENQRAKCVLTRRKKFAILCRKNSCEKKYSNKEQPIIMVIQFNYFNKFYCTMKQ